jgi:DNA primase large subunit
VGETKDIKELLFAAKFPFTKAARDLISAEVTIDYDLMERSKKRVEDAAFGRRIMPTIINDQSILFRELLSFPIAKLIISQIDKRFKREVMDNFVSAEAMRSIDFLKNEKNFEMDAERLCRELGISRKGYNIDIFSFLKFAPAEHFYLENQDIADGYVLLDKEKFLAIIFEAVKRTIAQKMKAEAQVPEELKEDIAEVAGEINKKLESYKRIRWKREERGRTEDIPPCMERIIDRMLAGENIPHIARWVIGIYLIKSGKSIDEIVNLFSHLPNFDEKRTRYYLEYIKKKGYSVPSCANMESYGLCISNCGIRNPMAYRKK